jgi:hypothetical protein
MRTSTKVILLWQSCIATSHNDISPFINLMKINIAFTTTAHYPALIHKQDYYLAGIY